jgi:hypothetical protein
LLKRSSNKYKKPSICSGKRSLVVVKKAGLGRGRGISGGNRLKVSRKFSSEEVTEPWSYPPENGITFRKTGHQQSRLPEGVKIALKNLMLSLLHLLWMTSYPMKGNLRMKRCPVFSFIEL